MIQRVGKAKENSTPTTKEEVEKKVMDGINKVVHRVGTMEATVVS